jgi:cell division protein FtsI (penicillin-binding protein 3)
VLEYLGVPHDEPLKSAPALARAAASARDDVSEPVGDLNALFAEVNDLPPDDPLRNPAPTGATVPQRKDESEQAAAAGTPAGEAPAAIANAPITADAEQEPLPAAQVESVTVNAGQRVAVPSFLGANVRRVTEQAAAAALGVQMIGSGIAREQAPAPGTMVPTGTEVVVRVRR